MKRCNILKAVESIVIFSDYRSVVYEQRLSIDGVLIMFTIILKIFFVIFV